MIRLTQTRMKIHHASSIRTIKNKLFTDQIEGLMFIRAFTDKCKSTTDGRLFNKINKKEIITKSNVPDELAEIISKIIQPH
jgi:hypothetical protein